MKKLPKQEHAAEETQPAPDQEALENCHNEALALQAEGQNPYPGSNYVHGVIATLAWVLGEADDAPLEW